MATLPWIDRTNVATLLLLALGLFALIRAVSESMPLPLWKQPLVVLSGLYYLLFVLAWIRFPHDPRTVFALQQKSAFLLAPPLFYVLKKASAHIRDDAAAGLTAGTLAALLCCFLNAALRYWKGHQTQVFFYHDYASPTGANAIYLSVYCLVVLVLLMRFTRSSKKVWLPVATAFVLLNLFLLSSKTLIAAGVLILFLSLISHRRYRTLAYSLPALALVALLLLSDNEVVQRYRAVNWRASEMAFTRRDYSEVQFDGLNLRLLLWRAGHELVVEHRAWLDGLGGRHYQYALNRKLQEYRLYSGYQNIDLHSQYMEAYVGFGIPGLLLLLALPAYAAATAVRQRRPDLLLLCLIFCISFLTESLLENQSGILLFALTLGSEWIPQPL